MRSERHRHNTSRELDSRLRGNDSTAALVIPAQAGIQFRNGRAGWLARKPALLAGLALLTATSAGATPFKATTCPPTLTTTADCFEAHEPSGAWVLAAIPKGKTWNRRLIVHAHGGPRLGAPKAGDSAEDLERYAAMVKAGYAWIGSTYRRGGYGVRMAAADVEASRQLFLAHWPDHKPDRILLHGQSWGGNVAAKVSELYALDIDGQRNYDGVLTTNGVLSGGTRAYQFRADLRAVYQYYCHNHPAADEPQYPLWQGLPTDAALSREQLRQRLDDCTGIQSAPDQRSPEQVAHLRDILAVTGIVEAQLESHLAWATFHFQDLVQRRLDGRNPFDNSHTVYRGSSDDKALNAGVERFSADPAAVVRLAYDADLSGLIVLPTLTVHAQHDPTVSPTAQAAYAATMAAADRSELLAQVSTDESDHSRLHDTTYLSVLQALEGWLDTGKRPDVATVQGICLGLEKPAPATCRFAEPRLQPD